MIEPLKEMQDALGIAHDADVAVALLKEFEARSASSGGSIEPYLERRRSQLLEARASFERVWPTLIAESLRRRLGAAVASLS